MKITKKQLQKLIKEEIANINENVESDHFTNAIKVLRDIITTIAEGKYDFYGEKGYPDTPAATGEIMFNIQKALDELLRFEEKGGGTVSEYEDISGAGYVDPDEYIRSLPGEERD